MAKVKKKYKDAPSGKAKASTKPPNILVIWGDDIGISNLSCYTHGLMGYQTPNIDRIAKEGMMFTDSYGEQSCTAGRSSFITGQSVLAHRPLQGRHSGRAAAGMQREIVTIADLFKNQGYATGQFGKNHLGDLNNIPADRPRLRRVLRQSLSPQCRGRAGNVRLLSGKGLSELRESIGPRGVIHSWATDKDDPTEETALGQSRQAENRGHRAR